MVKSQYNTICEILIVEILKNICCLCDEEQLNPGEYYYMVNSANKNRMKWTMGCINTNKESE